MGGRIRGGFYGLPPPLTRLDANGNLPYAVDFRDLYSTVLAGWWRLPPGTALDARFRPIEFLRA